jgi:hypothetical protein
MEGQRVLLIAQVAVVDISPHFPSVWLFGLPAKLHMSFITSVIQSMAAFPECHTVLYRKNS